MTRVAVLMTAHNRVEATANFLERLFSDVPDAVEMMVFLVDDGSNDGTATRASAVDPRVQVIQGDGSLYWSGGMRLASSTAHAWRPDLIIWANDDLQLAENAVRRTISMHQAGKMKDSVWVGNVVSPEDMTVVYGGRYQRADNPISFALCANDDMGVRVHTLNGNFVAIDAKIYFDRLGGFPLKYRHAYSDLLLGLRAGRAGLDVKTLPFVAGYDRKNPRTGKMFDHHLSLGTRVKFAVSVFGLPPKDHFRFCREVSGLRLGAVLFLRSYVRVFFPRKP
jgi:GT2 family glycosyltransferase